MATTLNFESSLTLASKIEHIAELFSAVGSMPKQYRPTELASVCTFVNAKLKKSVIPHTAEILDFVSKQGQDVNAAKMLLAKVAEVQSYGQESKFGSSSITQYTINTTSSGVRVNKLGAKTNMVVQLAQDVTYKVNPYTFVSEFIPYKNLVPSVYDAVMNRIVTLRTVEHWITNEEGKKIKVQETVPFTMTDFLLKTTLIQDSDVVLDSLLANPNFVLVLHWTGSQFIPVNNPMDSSSIRTVLDERFGAGFTTYTAPSKAKDGYVEVDANLKDMARLKDGTFYSIAGAKKFVARQEKLNGDNYIARVKTRVFLVTEATATCNAMFDTGCFYASHKMLFSIGCCRITSDIDNLLVKGATHYAPWIQADVGMHTSICAATSAKGGLISVLKTLGHDVDMSDINVIPELQEEEITLTNGEVVKGVYANITVKITNAYTAEMFTRYDESAKPASLAEAETLALTGKVENLLQYDKEKANALSKQVLMKVAKDKQTIVDVLSAMEADREIMLKSAQTTYTQAEFEIIAMSFGDDIAIQHMASLIATGFNTMDFVTKAASQWLKGETGGDVLSASLVLETYRRLTINTFVDEESKVISSANTQFLRKLMEELDLVGEGWKYIPEMDISIPKGEPLYGNLFSEKNDFELVFELPTALKYFLSSFIYIHKIDKAGNLKDSTLKMVGSRLHFMIQDSLLNKKVSKIKVHGKYMTLLPGFWLKNKYDVCLLSRDMYQPQFSHLAWTKVNIAKHPTLFIEAVAGFKCYNEIPGVEVSDELRSIYMNTIFVHPDYLLELSNDCDGDLARVSFTGTWLPLFSGKVMNTCFGAYHANYKAGEQDYNLSLTKPKVSTFTHSDLYAAIKEACDSKMNVAVFTDNLHKALAAYRSSTVTEKLVNERGEEGLEIIRQALVIVASMVQTDAMNAIKHDGGVLAGASITAVEINREGGLDVAKEALEEYFKAESVVKPCEDFASIIAELMFYTNSVIANTHKPTLNNQFERLVFKNQPNMSFIYTDENGKERVGKKRCNFHGMFKDSWNVTGTYSMFSEYVEMFYGR